MDKKRFIKLNLYFTMFILIAVAFSNGALTDGLTAYYPLENVSDVHSGHDGVVAGGITFTPTGCKLGNCAQAVDQTSNYISILENGVNNSAGLFDTPNGSIQAWINPQSMTTNGRYTTDRTASGDNLQMYYLQSTAQNQIDFRLANGSIYSVSNSMPQNSGWYHTILTWGANGMELYQDGVLVDTHVTTSSWTANTNMVLFCSTAFTSQCWRGLMDEVGFWDRQLSQSEVTELYNNGTGIAYPLADVQAPTITLVYPTNNSNFTTEYTNLLNITTDENAVCTVNSASFTLQQTNNLRHDWIFNSVITQTTNFDLTFNCTDPASNWAIENLKFNVIVDDEQPTGVDNSEAIKEVGFMFIMVLIWLVLFAFSIMTKIEMLFNFTSLYGIFLSIVTFTNTGISNYLALILLLINCFILVSMNTNG